MTLLMRCIFTYQFAQKYKKDADTEIDVDKEKEKIKDIKNLGIVEHADEMHLYLSNLLKNTNTDTENDDVDKDKEKIKDIKNLGIVEYIKKQHTDHFQVYQTNIECKIDYEDLYMIDSLIELTLIYIWHLRENVNIVNNHWSDYEDETFTADLKEIVDTFVSRKCAASSLGDKYLQHLHSVSL